MLFQSSAVETILLQIEIVLCGRRLDGSGFVEKIHFSIRFPSPSSGERVEVPCKVATDTAISGANLLDSCPILRQVLLSEHHHYVFSQADIVHAVELLQMPKADF